MSEIRNRPNPLNQYGVINTVDLTTTNLSSTNITGVTTITGSNAKIMGTSGSINFGDCVSAATGSVQTALGLKVTITGSTYVIPLYR
jgi:hypothetical protein